MALDARVRYTKKVIKENFIALLEKKPLNKITVKEICELSEINRATFYKYYNDVFDLMEKLELEILAELRETIQGSKKTTVSETIQLILKEMRLNGKTYSAMFSNNGDTSFPSRIFLICYEEIAESMDTQFKKLPKEKREWLYLFIAHGSSGILDCWLENGMTEPEEEIAEFIDRLIENTLRDI